MSRLAAASLLLAFFLCPAAAGATFDPARADAALRRATAWLLSRQGPDGAWRSETYGGFKDGWSLTPVVMSALLFAPEDPAIPAAYARGADFLAGLAARLDPAGDVRPGPDGPTYVVESLSGAAFVLSVPANRRHLAARDALVRALRARQLTEANGWTPADPSHGGWGYFPRRPVRPPAGQPVDDALAANLPATLFAVAALRFAGAPAEDPALVAARAFAGRCQRLDGGDSPDEGGFFFMPGASVQNKAGHDAAGRPRPYGSMTADGLRVLLRAGAPRDDPRVKAAVAWLHRRFEADRAVGDYPPERGLQRDAVYYYSAWSTAHALMLAGHARFESAAGPVDWPAALSAAVLRRQRPDGSWANRATDLREDDPLLATPFAMAAVGVSRLVATGQWRTAVDMEGPPARNPRK